MKKTEKNKVLVQAWQDYDPEIVKINEEKIATLNLENFNLIDKGFNFLKDRNIKDSIRYIIGLNSINYQFWDIVDNQFVRYENKGKTGALGMEEGFNQFFSYLEKHNFDINYIDQNLINQCFGNISNKEERIEILRESMENNNFEKVFSSIINHINIENINVDLADNIAHIMHLSYDDPYLKKIQLALYQISHKCKEYEMDVGCEITVAADYQLPKVLEGMEVLSYSQELSEKIDKCEIIEENSPMEKALRAATILACDEISEQHNIDIPTLDKWLWLERNNHKKKFHLTRTTNY